MMMKLFLPLFLLVSSYCYGCELTLPRQILVLGNGPGMVVQESKDCSEEFQSHLQQILIDVEGSISSSQLTEMLTQKGHSEFALHPQMVHVSQLKAIVRDQLQLPSGIQVRETRGVNVSNLIGLNPGDRIELHCTGCLFGQQQPLNVKINSFDGETRSFIATADFKKMVRAFRITSNIASFSTIDPQQSLREEYVEAVPHTELLTHAETLKFYRTNKPLRAGDLLKNSDLNAVNLVRAGLKTEVILENEMIRIKTQGISRSNGSLGDLVEVFHPQKNRKYQGKVVDINKVLVEL